MVQHYKDFLPTSYAGPSTPQLAPKVTDPSPALSFAPSLHIEQLHQPEPPLDSQEGVEPAGPSHLLSPSPTPVPDKELPRHQAPLRTKHISSTSTFGLYREFPIKPKRDPEETVQTLDAFCDPTTFHVEDEALRLHTPLSKEAAPPDGEDPICGANSGSRAADDADSNPPPYTPFPNISTFDMLYWQNNESITKSNAQLNLLTRGVFQEPGFNVADLAHFDAAHEVRRLDEYVETDERSPLSAKDGWTQSSVHVRLPKEGVRYESEEHAPLFAVEGLWHRSLPQVIRSALQRPGMKTWHMIPHKLFALQPSRSHSVSRSPSPSPSSTSSHSSSSACSSHTASSSGDDDGIRVRTEIYNSDAAIEEYDRILDKPREEGDPDDLEYSMTMICWYSDATRLTNFGPASMYPLYHYFGNQSKYERVRPSLYPAHHLAYIPSLPDTIQDVYTEIYGIPATAAVLTFLKRELIQAIILLILDTDNFMYIYVHGQIIDCGDGVRRRDFPRFFIWSADYVEKVILACIKYLARCHCPRCRINKEHTIGLGTLADIYRRNKVREDNDDVVYRITLVRKWIFEEGMPLTSVHLDRILGDLSLTPTRSAMSMRLRDHGFNFYSLFVPDFLHEFKLGVWKSIFTHFMRILYAAGGDKIQEFNKRFRQVPTFGRSTIRRFSTNVSDQGKLAARDYEDRLQCFMPVWDALLPGIDNRITTDLTFDLCMFLSLGKLRAHVPETLQSLDNAAIAIGSDVRTFVKKTCGKYDTVELPREAAARGRREARLTAQGKNVQGKAKASSARNRKSFNPQTYKLHALMDYACTCRMHGPTDNTSTQTGECEHCRIKRLYERTNKHRHVGQIAKHTRRADKLQIIKMRTDEWRTKLRVSRAKQKLAQLRSGDSPPPADPASSSRPQPSQVTLPGDASEEVIGCSPDVHYHIAESRRNVINISNWTFDNRGDPALKDFSLNLQNHLLARLAARFGPMYTPEEEWQASDQFSFADRSRLVIHKGRMYSHQILRLNYTTYDLRRSQDIINPRTHGDIMLLSGEEPDPNGSSSAHGYEYARVIKIFHVNVRLEDSSMAEFERMDVLFVRWFQVDHSVPGGFKAKRLYRVAFTPPGDDEPAFGFIDPSYVVRASHIIPAFAHGRTDKLLGPSLARNVAIQLQADMPSNAADTDFRYHYINLFADRDIFMRYYGGGIGHRANTQTTALDIAMDDEDIGSEWQDIDPELAEAQAAEEEYDRQVAEQPDVLRRLAPDIAGHPGGVRAAIFEEAEQNHLLASAADDGANGDGPDSDLEGDAADEDGRDEEDDSEDVVSGDRDLPFPLDEYALEGYAPP
ncbi:hypothetical protein C8Q80DRAFT_1263018 [Daedaleopsis nitida]|nr:hypothetical protein C8Q80DRAFT_1263018 [Daedaleopsis nitida]